MGMKLKKVKLNGISTKTNCHECGKEFSYYLWSPFWCPDCDRKRVEKITRQLKTICDNFKIKSLEVKDGD